MPICDSGRDWRARGTLAFQADGPAGSCTQGKWALKVARSISLTSCPPKSRSRHGCPHSSERGRGWSHRCKHLMLLCQGGQGGATLDSWRQRVACFLSEKGRASHVRLLRMTGKWPAVSLTLNLLLVFRWIPCEYNVTDGESRKSNPVDVCSSRMRVLMIPMSQIPLSMLRRALTSP